MLSRLTVRTAATLTLALGAVACDPGADSAELGTAEQPLELVLVQPADLARAQLDLDRFQPAPADVARPELAANAGRAELRPPSRHAAIDATYTPEPPAYDHLNPGAAAAPDFGMAEVSLRDDARPGAMLPEAVAENPRKAPPADLPSIGVPLPPVVIITPVDAGEISADEPAPSPSSCKAECAAQGGRATGQMISLDDGVECVCYAAPADFAAPALDCQPLELVVHWTDAAGAPQTTQAASGYRCQ